MLPDDIRGTKGQRFGFLDLGWVKNHGDLGGLGGVEQEVVER